MAKFMTQKHVAPLFLVCLLFIQPCYADDHRVYKQQSSYRDFVFAAADEATIHKRKQYYQSLPKEEKQKLKKARKEYQVLSEEEKQKLRKRWEKKPESEKKRYKSWENKQ